MRNPLRLQDLVERQAQRWQLAQAGATPPRPARCVAVSRLPWALGEELAQRVAEKLDYGYFGIEIVDRIAREEGVQRELVADLDEHLRSGIDRWVVDAFRRRTFRETDYLRAVVRVAATLAERGMAVIVGRGAPYVLGHEQALRVLVTAPDDVRAERLARAQGVSEQEARARLRAQDADRFAFLRGFVPEPNDPRHFDLCVNTATLGLDDAVRVVVDALQPGRRR